MPPKAKTDDETKPAEAPAAQLGAPGGLIKADSVDQELRDREAERAAAEQGESRQAAAKQGAEQSDLCTEHFPNGWLTPIITRTDRTVRRPQPTVTCEHGTYTRPKGD